MKAFIAYRSTGEDPKLLEPLITSVRDALTDKGIDAHCLFFDEQIIIENNYSPRQILDYAFKFIDGSDFVFALQSSDNKSGGMLMEVGYSLAKDIPIVAAVKKGLEFKLISNVADVTLPWTDNSSLIEAIQNFEFANIRLAPPKL
jgi:hypothetical protein